MKQVRQFRIEKIIILLLVLAVIHLIAAHFFVGTPKMREDSRGYIAAMRFLRGEQLENTQVPYNRILTTPAMLYSAIAGGYLVGNLADGILVVNIILYFLLCLVFFRLVMMIYQDRKVAFLATLLFIFNFYFFWSAFSYLFDLGGWFFFVLATFWAVKFYQNQSNIKFYYLAIFSSSVGVLFKEYGALGLISLCLLIFLAGGSPKERIIKIIRAGLLFMVIPLAYHLFFYWQYHYSYFDWYFYNTENFSYSLYNLETFIKVIGWLYLAGWPVFLWGLWQEKRYFQKERAKIMLALLPASLSFFAWPAFVQRVAVVFIPWLVMVSAFGLSKLNKYLVVVILLFYAVVNYNIEFLIKAINLPF